MTTLSMGYIPVKSAVRLKVQNLSSHKVYVVDLKVAEPGDLVSLPT